MDLDPFMPAFRRFPRNPMLACGSDAEPSSVRPFVLREALVGQVPEGKHRTGATRVPHTQPTTSDGARPMTRTDTYYTPDD